MDDKDLKLALAFLKQMREAELDASEMLGVANVIIFETWKKMGARVEDIYFVLDVIRITFRKTTRIALRLKSIGKQSNEDLDF